MTVDSARNRWLLIGIVRLAFAAGSVFGLILYARHPATEVKLMAGALVLMGIYCMTVIPKAMAHRWRTPPES